MKHNSKQFLALFMAVSMAVAPVSGVYAEDQNAAVENAVNANVQEDSETGQNETASNVGQEESSVTAAGSQEENKTEAAENETTGSTQNMLTGQKDGNVQQDQQQVQNKKAGVQVQEGTDTAADKDAKKNAALAKLSAVSGTTDELKEGTYKVETKAGGSSRTSITCEEVEVKDGKATARIVFSSAGYPKLWVNVNGIVKEYEKRTDSAAGTSAFDIPVDINKEMNVIGYVEKMDSYTEYKLNINISKETEPTTPAVPGTESTTPAAPETENKTLTDGSYQVDVDTGNKMFKVTNCILTSEKGKMYAVITLSGTGYDYLYMGTAADAAEAAAKDYISYVADEAGKYTYKVPVESLDKGIAVAAHSIKKDKWYDRTLIFSSASAKRIIADGTYQVNAEAGGKMFRVVNCVMKVKGGQMMASVTLSGQGYNRIYLGDVNDAANDENNWILPDSLLAEQYTFQIPVEKLDEVMTIAVHTTKSNKWDTRTLTFHSEGMTKIADSNNGNASNDNNGSNGSLTPGGDNNNSGNTSNGNNSGNTGNTGNNTTSNGKPDKESKYESDLNKSTERVNSTTGLKDGVYTPDSFSWSGGTGKVSITCSKVTVTGGQAYATITFSSPHYQYVKANGNVYYPSSKTGSSTSFVIPVELNKNNSVVGMTTAMSTAHEIKYTIFVYIAEAAKDNASARANGKEVTVIGANGSDSKKTAAASKKMDEVAPEIIGLEYQSETKAEHAKYFKIYHYDQGITLLEIDMNKKTGRKAAGKKWKEVSETSGLNPAEQEQAALYLNNVVKYLIVPENAEIPAGLDKEVIVVRQPADHVYAGTNKTISLMEEQGQLEKVTAVGVKKNKCSNETIKTKMEEKEVVYAGTSGKLNYKKLVKNKCNLALLSASVLPEKGSSKKAAKKKMTAYRKMTEKMTLLQIPVIVDRAKDEKGKDAQKEWGKVYQVILGYDGQSAK